MSSIDGSFGAQPWSARIAGRWGHHGAQLLIVSIIAVIAMRVYPPPADSPVALLLPVTLIVVVLTSWMLMRRHDRGLCEHCLAAMPLDASATAARFQWRFQVCHLGSNKPVVIGYLALLIGSNFLPGMAGMIVWIAVQTSMIYLVLSYSTHRRLQPWCPWCRGGGTDEDVDAPDPVPLGHQHL